LSAKLTVQGGTDGFGLWGGIIRFPQKVREGDDLWIQLYIFMPTDFVVLTPGNGSLKFLRIRTTTSAGANAGFNDIQIQDDGNWESEFRMIKERQDRWFNFGAVGSFPKGQWHRITANLSISSVPSSAGGRSRVRVWQNGILLVDEPRMQTLSTSTDVADALYLFTYWNGNAPKTQSLWVDQLRIANGLPSWALDLQGVSP
jgi:hypothetical protein